jgi:hypothetical protein
MIVSALSNKTKTLNGSRFGCHSYIRIIINMHKYSSEDYAPSIFKESKRINLIKNALELTRDILDGRMVNNGGIKGLVDIKPKFAEDFVKAYFENVTRFKMIHGYAPSDRINEPKIAALMLKTLASFSWKDAYYCRDGNSSDGPLEMLYCELAFQLVRIILGIPVGAVPPELARDFYICVERGPSMSDEWACWSMANYLKAFGALIRMDD